VRLLLASQSEVDINKKSSDNKTALEISIETSTQKFGLENDKTPQKYQKSFPLIVELLESYQKNLIETKIKLRKELNLPPLQGNLLFFFFFSSF